MKIAFSTMGNDLSSPVETRFGRSPQFLVFDTDNDNFEIVEYAGYNAPSGAGIKAAETIIRAGATILVTGDCGPKALNALKQSNVQIYSSRADSIKQALEDYQNGNLAEIK